MVTIGSLVLAKKSTSNKVFSNKLLRKMDKYICHVINDLIARINDFYNTRRLCFCNTLKTYRSNTIYE